LISDELMPLPLAKGKLTRQLGCIYPRERTLSNAARQFLQLLRTHATAVSQ